MKVTSTALAALALATGLAAYSGPVEARNYRGTFASFDTRSTGSVDSRGISRGFRVYRDSREEAARRGP